MSATWLPVLVVLAAGLVSGLVAARRLRVASPAATEAADRALRLADLERRRDSLYRQIRTSGEGADRDRLETSAAHVLRDLDVLKSESPSDAAPESAAAAVVSPAAESAPADVAAASQGGRAMLTGFLFGGALVALVGVLVYWAVRDAQPRPEDAAPAPTSVAAGEHPTAPLPADVQVEIDALRRSVEADPSDLLAHKRLALALLGAESFLESFEMAGQILAAFPDDPDGLYIQGMVRLTMGQDEEALTLLDRVLEQYPNHVMALAGRGMLFFRSNDREAAVMVWERALAAAGGSHPDIEQLLAMARAEAGGAAAAPAPTTSEPPAAADESGSPPADSYTVVVELAQGVSAPPTATLFVFLRAEEQGPPAAVKRLHGPAFPLRLSLGPGDTMLGRPLPTSGTISVRLDADGSASTKDDDDLFSEADAAVGSQVRVVLGQ